MLWEDFWANLQAKNPMPNMPKNPKIQFTGAPENELGHKGNSLSPVGDSPATVPGEPLRCFSCLCWQRVPGLAWWCGQCAATGRKLNMQTRCDRGFEERQSATLPKRTAPQSRAHHVQQG